MSGTAEVNPNATLTPSKLELIQGWIGQQPWFEGDAGDLQQVARFRFVDPDGEVGIETHLLRSQGIDYQVPLTYRAEPLEDAEGFLVGTMEHSELGTRHVYDALGDPVYMVELTRVIREGDNEADLSAGEKTMSVEGSGVVPTVDVAGQLRIIRELDGRHTDAHAARGVLIGTWTEEGTQREEVLAVLR